VRRAHAYHTPQHGIAVTGGLATASENLHISIFDLYYGSQSHLPRHQAECLGPLLSLPAHTLTFHIYPLSEGYDDVETGVGLWQGVFSHLLEIKYEDHICRRTRRLALCWKWRKSTVHFEKRLMEGFSHSLQTRVCCLVLRTSMLWEMTRGKLEGWKFSFDFENGMATVKGEIMVVGDWKE
jgi:hypothetical protein